MRNHLTVTHTTSIISVCRGNKSPEISLVSTLCSQYSYIRIWTSQLKPNFLVILLLQIMECLLAWFCRDLSNNQIQKIAVDAFRNLKSMTSLWVQFFCLFVFFIHNMTRTWSGDEKEVNLGVVILNAYIWLVPTEYSWNITRWNCDSSITPPMETFSFYLPGNILVGGIPVE